MSDDLWARKQAARDFAQDWLAVLRRSWWLLVVVALVGAVAALGLSVLQTPMYSASTTLYVTSGSASGEASAAYQGSLASQQRVASYAKLVRSDVIVNEALDRSGVGLNEVDAKQALSASASPDTVLLTISAVDRSPEVAIRLANGAAESMVDYVTTLEKPSASAVPLAKLTVISPATETGPAISPKTRRNVLVGGVVGILVSLFFVIARERFRGTVITEMDVESLISPVLTSVPVDSTLRSAGPIEFDSGDPSVAEAYRRLRVNLSFLGVDSPIRVVLLTSAVEGEGKTTTAANLAACFSELGGRVLVVGADLRKPGLATRLSVNSGVGLTDVLTGRMTLEEAVQVSPVSGVHVLASGTAPPNPSELLGSKKMVQCLDQLRSSFDFVIIDTPPVMPVTDAAVLSSLCDAVILVVRARAVRRRELAESVKRLSSSRSIVVGSILNCGPSAQSYYRYSEYRSVEASAAAGLPGREVGGHIAT